MNMRSLWESSEASIETVAHVINRAQQLLNLQDEDAAQSFALHKINVITNDYPEDQAVVPHCMIFPDLDSLLTVLPYRHARLQVLRTCRYLEDMLKIKPHGYSREVESRTLKNILMCWPRTLGVPGNIGNGSVGIIMQSAVFIWCILSDDEDSRSDCHQRLWVVKKAPWSRDQFAAHICQCCSAVASRIVGMKRWERIPHPGAPITTLVGTFFQRVRE
ncbi:hypothetical protein AC579_8504 [Pseudocercospora musae]|uniref:Uncharacterized protein n=1 Tax=Pseudocercospora musae TaxID=113226 RepID=A0A139IG80_9PEZI|nr:hypothetical protein AC579_8504 [Pseudocercospora musae]